MGGWTATAPGGSSAACSPGGELQACRAAYAAACVHHRGAGCRFDRAVLP